MRRFFAVLAGLLGGAFPVFAQSPAPSAATPVPTFGATLTVTASADLEPAGEVPATVDVATADEIARRQAVAAIDLLRTLPGLDLARAGSPGKAASLFTRGTNSSHTLVLWNGVALNDPYLGGFDWSTLALEGIERLEVVRGSFSALYGSSAVGGVVQLVSRREGSGGNLRLEAGSNQLARGGVAAGAARGPLRLDLAGHLRRSEGELANDFFDGEEIDLGAELRPAPGFRLSALLRRQTSEIGLPFGFDRRPTPRQRQRSAATTVALPLSWNGSAWELEALAAQTRTALEVEDRDDPFAASEADGRRDQGRLLVRRAFGRGFTLTVGADGARDRVESASAFGPALRGDRQRTWAAFAQGALARGPLRLDVGVRRDDNDAFGGATSLRVAGALRLSDRVRLRAGYGESFRAPSLADLYYPGFSNPELVPERGESLELAAEIEAGRARLLVAAFENRLEQLIEFDFATLRPVNLGRARARGIEASAELAAGIFAGRLAATFQEAEDRASGRPLLRRPERSASLTAFVRPGAWTFGAVARYVGSRLDFGEIRLDAYATLDLQAAWRVSDRFEPFARIENVADARYQELAGYPAPGVGAVAGCALRF